MTGFLVSSFSFLVFDPGCFSPSERETRNQKPETGSYVLS